MCSSKKALDMWGQRRAPIRTRLLELSRAVTPAKELANFLTDQDDVVKQFRMLSRAISRDYEVVISLDFCELMDAALGSTDVQRYQRQLREVGLSRGLILDATFAREAIDALTRGQCKFTFLPGLTTELLLFLRSSYDHNAMLMARLAEHGLPVDSYEALLEWAKGDTSYRLLDNILRDEELRIVLLDNIIHIVTTLMSSRYFVSPSEMTTTPVQGDIYEQYKGALDVMRPDYKHKIGNFADAYNLAVAHNCIRNAASSNTRQLIVHMTRTPALHKLRVERARFHLSATIDLEGAEFPVLCQPQLPCLFACVAPGPRYPDDLYRNAEQFSQYFGLVASNLRLFEDAVSQNASMETIESVLAAIQRNGEDYACRDALTKYLGLFMRSAVESEQALTGPTYANRSESKYVLDKVRASAIQASILEHQERVLSLYGVLRRQGGLEDATQAVIRESSIDIGRELSKAERLGFAKATVTVHTTPHRWYDVVLHVSHTDPTIAVGLQFHVARSGNRANIYWPSCKSPFRFLEAVGSAYVHTLVNSTCTVVAVSFDGMLQIFKLRIPTLQQPGRVFAKLKHKPVRAIQIAFKGVVATWEACAPNRTPLCSLRVNGEVPKEVVTIYAKTLGALPSEYLLDFLQVHYRET